MIADLCPVCCPHHPQHCSTGAYHATEVAKEDTAAWAGNVGYLATPVPGQVGNLEKELAMVAGDLKAPGVPGTPVDPTRTVKWFVIEEEEDEAIQVSTLQVPQRRSAEREFGLGQQSEQHIRIHPGLPGFNEGHRVKRLSRKPPGDEMSQLLVESGTKGGRLLPIVLKYLSLSVLRKDMIPGQRREITTLDHVLDRMVRRDAMDIVNHRIKALELAANGSSWSAIQHLE